MIAQSRKKFSVKSKMFKNRIWAAYRAFAFTALVPRAVIGSIAAAGI